jgi:DNA-binding transcriptional LysR family regulator
MRGTSLVLEHVLRGLKSRVSFGLATWEWKARRRAKEHAPYRRRCKPCRLAALIETKSMPAAAGRRRRTCIEGELRWKSNIPVLASCGRTPTMRVFAGFGLAVASEWMFAPELKSGAVRSVLDDWWLPPIDLWAVFPTGRQASAKARSLRASSRSKSQVRSSWVPVPEVQ